MPTDHFAQFFPTACAGLGLFLVGIANLLLSGRRLRVRLAATLMIVVATLAGVGSLNQPGAMSGTALFLALGLLAFYLLASGRMVHGLTAVIGFLHRPLVRYALLTVGGIGLVFGAVVRFESADEAALDAGLAELDLLNRPEVVPSNRATATTDHGSPIVLKELVAEREGTDWDHIEDRTLKGAHLDGQVIRRGGATEQSNCHGWVFADGKFNIPSDSVELILKENGYQETHEPHPGDLTIYRQGGAVAHTAIVRYVTEGQPVMVEGKWGALGVFLHPADKCTYGTDYTFYRSHRHGHLLAGLGGSNPPPPPQPVATE